MIDFIANLYEGLFYNSDYQILFDFLYQIGGLFNGYNVMVLIFIALPIIIWSIFYFIYKKPTAGLSTWILWWVGIALLVAGVTYWFLFERIFSAVASNVNSDDGDLIKDLLNKITDETTGYNLYANHLIIYLSLYNALLSLVWGFIYSIFIKRWSKQFIHLPF